ncbi:hypothetical protein FO519_004250 [Halicephalobus sp. NKZ332]|nr:hypothetical protein FO519_004250 [Halicephalobus sp. NKZ332]
MSKTVDDTHDHFEKNNSDGNFLTTATGAPIGRHTVMTAGPRGPMLLQDVVYLDKMAHFDRERIPERVVHAKGAGAHGYFEVTHDIKKYTKAVVFSEVGKRTPIFVRFSTIVGESGSADTNREPRGFAVKFYTEEGNWDLVGNSTPIFFIKDPILFPDLIHAQKRNKVTNLKDTNSIWDFWTRHPECIHEMLLLFTDRGIPDGYRHMDGYASHTFKFVNKDGNFFWCKFHAKTRQKIRNLHPEKALELTATDPDYATRDLYEAIEKRNFPEWDFFIQIMTPEEAEKFRWNPFDVTKVWFHGDFPLIPVGKIVLNRNPRNYFVEVEQSAFSPSHVIPGIEFSPDKLLQGRLFSYRDAHYHRLGPNHIQLPINCPYRTRVNNTQKDGLMNFGSYREDFPNYHPKSFGKFVEKPDAKEHTYEIQGQVDRHGDSPNVQEDDNYSQPCVFWTKVLDEGARCRLIENIVAHAKQCYPEIQERIVEVVGRVHPDLKNRLKSGFEKIGREKARI